MIRRFALLAYLSLATSLSATSMMNIGPLAKADAISIEEIVVGEPLAREGLRVQGLFDNSSSDLSKFKASLRSGLEHQLGAGGLKVAAGSPFVLIVSIYGGKYETREDAPNYFLVEITVAEIGNDCVSGPDATKLGVASDIQLAPAVRDIVSEAVAQFLDERAAYRKAKAPAAN